MAETIKVQVAYENDFPPSGKLYTFEAPEGTKVGDRFMDYKAAEIVQVQKIGSDYTGECRKLED